MSLTLFILLITIGVTFGALSNERLFVKLLMNPYQTVHQKQYWRLITSGFVHNGYAHLGVNMFTFFFFGGIVEETFLLESRQGSTVFVLFYLSAIVLSDLPVVWRNRDNPSYNSLGASGAVSAIVFASILYYPTNYIYIMGILPLPGFLLGILYIGYSYSQSRNADDNINHEAHLYGAIYGLIFALAISPNAGADFFKQIVNFSF